MSHATDIDRFLGRVRQEIMRARLQQVAAWTLLATGCLGLVTAIAIIATGRAVPLWVYAVCAALGLITAMILCLARQPDRRQVAHTADTTFDLHDTLVSYLGFHADRRSGMATAQSPLIELQAQATSAAIKNCDISQVRPPAPRRTWLVALLSCLVAGSLGFVDESQHRRDDRLIAEETERTTTAIKAALEEVIDELQKGAEQEAITDLDGVLDEMKDALAATPDPKTAMRQYAEMERKLREQMAKLTPKEEKDLLDQAAKALDQDPEGKPLAKDLKRQQYKEAAKKLEALKPTSEELKTAEELRKQRRRLARLKRKAQRLGQAARQAGQRSKQGKRGQTRAKNAAAKQSPAAAGASGKQSGQLAGAPADGAGLNQLMEDLEQATLAFEDALAKAERAQQHEGAIDPDKLKACKQAGDKLGRSLGKLGDKLRRIDKRAKASKALASLRKALGVCQSQMAGGQSQSLAAALSAALNGGQQAGQGSSEAPNTTEDEAFAGGADRLSGAKGSGPSQVSTEAADSGEAVSRRRASAQKRTFERQLEAFVARQDVPEDLKSGVKTYFETVHDVEQTNAGASE